MSDKMEFAHVHNTRDFVTGRVTAADVQRMFHYMLEQTKLEFVVSDEKAADYDSRTVFQFVIDHEYRYTFEIRHWPVRDEKPFVVTVDSLHNGAMLAEQHEDIFSNAIVWLAGDVIRLALYDTLHQVLL